MELTIKNTRNNTTLLEYEPTERRQDILNEIWREREDNLNNMDNVAEIILLDSITEKADSFLDNYDKETRHIQERRCYAEYISFRSLLDELKALVPVYKNYTIINFDCKGMSYDFEKEQRCGMHPTTKIDMLDTHNELIAELFTELIRFLKSYLQTGRDYYVYSFNVELLPNKIKSKRKRTHVPRGLRKEVFKRDNYRCVECGASKDDGATLHVDHKIPVSKGGTDELDNLQTLCSECNLNKSDVIQ